MSGHVHSWVDPTQWEYDEEYGEDVREWTCRGCPDVRPDRRPHHHDWSPPVPDTFAEIRSGLSLRVCRACHAPDRVRATA